MLDPFPGRELLDADDVRKLLGMPRTTFAHWLAESPEGKFFPKPVVVGHSPKRKKPITKYRKSEVMAFISILPRGEH